MRKKILHSILAIAIMFSVLPVSQVKAADLPVTNYVTNPGFEDDMTGWEYEGGGAAANEWGGVNSGIKSFEYYDAGAFFVKQTVTGLPSGLYDLELWIQGDASKSVEIFAENSAGEKKSSIVTNTGFGLWQKAEIKDIQVTTSQMITIGVVASGGNSWGSVDDVMLTRQPVLANYVKNPGFEDDMTGWEYEQGGAAANEWGGVNSGIKSFEYYDAGAFFVKQTVTGLPSGLYDLELWIQGDASKSVEIFAENSAGEKKSSIVTNTGFGLWQKAEIKDIQVTTSQMITIGAATSGGNSWGSIDDVTLKMQSVLTTDKTELQQAVDAAKLKVNNNYTRYSWNKFIEKLANADVVLDNVDATGEEIASAKNQLTSAMDALLEKQIINYDSIHVNPITELTGRTDFINGVDVSSLWIVAQKGAEFYDIDGSQPYPDDQIKNALAILRNNGVNWVRLRIWHDPNGALTNPSFSNKGPGGLNDLAVTIEIAKKAKELGLDFLLDFHYSDTWTHPGQHIKPVAWNGLGFSDLKQALYDYTDTVLKALIAADARPDMVQIGNENNDGMVHPEGHISNPGQYVELVKAGAAAVRANEGTSGKIKIMIHLAEGGRSSLFKQRFDLLQTNSVDYDVIGASYYPYWHGPISDVQANMNDMAARYGKEIVIAEVAYGYTNDYENIYPSGTQMGNIFGAGEEKDGKYKSSIQGQATALRDVIEIAAKVPNNMGIGTFYWEPAWLTTPEIGSGWGVGNTEASWANQALFNYRGQALPSIATYNLITQASYKEATIISIATDEVNISISQGSTLVLPKTVDALYSDDSVRGTNIEWDSFDLELLNQGGTFKVDGQIVGRSETIQANITVTPKNYVNNPSFENGANNWIITGSGTSVQKNSGNAKSGEYAVNYGNTTFKVAQTITGLEDGLYTLKLWLQGDNSKTATVFAENFGGETKTVTVTQKGWLEWQTPRITDINVTNGQCTIGFSSNGGSGWGWADDIELLLVTPAQPEIVDKTGLQVAIHTATQKVESEYTVATWTVLAGKLTTAQSIVTKTDATSAEVLAATTELNNAIAQLVKLVQPEIVDKTGLQVAIHTATQKVESEYTSATWIVFAGKLAAAQSIVIKTDATSAEVLVATTELEEAMSKLVKKQSSTGNTGNTGNIGNTGNTGGIGNTDKTITESNPITPKDEQTNTFKKITPPVLEEKSSERFTDLAKHWAANAMKAMINKGIMVGKSNSEFRPQDSLNRAEIAVILARLIPNTQDTSKTFKDIKGNEWYAESINRMASIGILGGYGDNIFKPKENIKRVEVIALLARLAAYNNQYQPIDSIEEALAGYKDASNIPNWARAEIAWAVKYGIIKGDAEGNLNFNQNITRSEMASVLDRMLE